MGKIKKSMLKVGNMIAPDGFPEGIIASVEKCTLESFIDGKKKKRWPCWTVRTKNPKPLHKYYITDWGEDGLIIWKRSGLKFAPPNAKLWADRSGLEEMENITGSGSESYIYSFLVFVLDYKAKTPKKFYAIERLRNGRIFRYEGKRNCYLGNFSN